MLFRNVLTGSKARFLVCAKLKCGKYAVSPYICKARFLVCAKPGDGYILSVRYFSKVAKFITCECRNPAGLENMPDKYYNQTENELDTLGKKLGYVVAGQIIGGRHEEYKERRAIPPGRFKIMFESTTGDPGHGEACSICPQEMKTLADGMVVENIGGDSLQKGNMIVRPVSHGQLAHFAALPCVKEGYKLDDLNAQFDMYGKKFHTLVHAGKAIFGKLAEERGDMPRILNDWAIVLDGQKIDEQGLGTHAHLPYGTKNDDWKALAHLREKETDIILRVRPKSYRGLLELADKHAKKVCEIEQAEFATAPSD